VFKDRREAGRELARRLAPYAPLEPLVVGLPRGGVPVAAEVAKHLGAGLDIIVVRKIGCPWQPELGIVRRTGHKRLRPETAPLRADYDRDPDLAFYARANPGHAEGDMLVCLCPLTFLNLVTLGMRARRRARRAPKGE